MILIEWRAGGRAPRTPLGRGDPGKKGAPNLTEYLCYGI